MTLSPPPIRTPWKGVPGQGNRQQEPSWPWLRWFQAIQTEVNLRVVSGPNPPPSSSSTGTVGQVSFDNNFFYVCVATNTWRRVAISSF